MRKHIRRACVHRSQMNLVRIPSKSNSPFLKPFLHSIRPNPHPNVLTHTSRHRQMVAAQRSRKACPARTRTKNDMRKRTAQRQRSANRKDAAVHSSRSPPRASHPLEE
ncbi:exo-alpha-sialidase [Trypanosoma cruzi]|nr:exo-alpha-sialidase [Trypanosoma cruzi]